MKKSILILIMMVFTIGVYGQEHHSHREFRHHDKGEMLEKMKEHLSLTDAQVVKIQAIDKKYEVQEEGLRSQMKELKEKHRDLREQKRAEIEKILTPEQQVKIKEIKAKRKMDRKSRKGMHKKGLKKSMKMEEGSLQP